MTTDLAPTPTGAALQPARRLRATVDQLRSALALRLVAATGDPVAAWLIGSPGTDPYAIFERVRARGPVARSRTGLRAVTGRDLCEEVLRDPRFGVRNADGSAAGGDRWPDLFRFPDSLGLGFLEMDPPDHTRLRRAAGPAFRPSRVRGWAPRLEVVVHRLMDAAEREATAHPGRPVDLMAALAAPFPIAVISEILGIPNVDAAHFARVGALVGQSLDGVRSVRQAEALLVAGRELDALFGRLLDQRAAEPADDVLSVIAAARAAGTASAADALSTAGLLLVAGFETTVNLIGNVVTALQADRARWADVVADPSLAGAAVEETLRLDPSVQGTMRVAHADVELAGVSLPAGSAVLVMTAAANRDPAAYREPAVFDLHRSGEPDHLSFASGIHYCLGAPLARLEGEVALRALVTRWPNLQVLPGARRRPGFTLRGWSRLPVRLSP